MTAKRWPHFPQLAEALPDVAVVGTADDLRQSDRTLLKFPSHARSFVDRLTLRQTAELMASAGVVVGNDSGLSHVAAAVGTPCVMIFGPTPHQVLGELPPHVTVVRRGLECEPCWFRSRFRACARRIDCLRELSVEAVLQALLDKVKMTEPKAAAGLHGTVKHSVKRARGLPVSSPALLVC
jgi:ADP-heptose:LPS heptosyltransferase